MRAPMPSSTRTREMSLLRRHGWSRVEVVKAYFPQYEWYEWLFRHDAPGILAQAGEPPAVLCLVGREARFSAAGRLVAADLRRLVEQLWDHALQHPAFVGRRTPGVLSGDGTGV